MSEVEISPNFFSSQTIPQDMISSLQEKVTDTNPLFVVIVLLILILYYLVYSTISGTNTSTSSEYAYTESGFGLIEISLWGLFIFLLVINGLEFFFSIDVKTVLKDLMSPNPTVDVVVNTPTEEPTTDSILQSKEVFHIPDNVYTFPEAKALCKAYNAELASYDQVKKAHSAGGEWCNYGWSKDQLALYPTQKETYDTLKTIKGHEHDCGRPGINGGFIANENVRFGVNCFGYKPKITQAESEKMAYSELYPKSDEDIKENHLIDDFKKKIPDIMLAPFNKTKWSRI